MNPPPSPWTRLVAAARQAPADRRDVSAPLGFSTRVAALGVSAIEPTFSVLFARFASRALGVCGLVMVLGVTLSFSSAANAFENDVAILNDPVTEWLDAASAS